MSAPNGKIVLVTGGAGYIGSHCVVTLQQAGYEVIALDNFANSVDDGCDGSLALKRVEKITGQPVTFYKCDLLDTVLLEKIFQSVSNDLETRLSIEVWNDSNDICYLSVSIVSTKSIRSFILLQ